MTRALAEINARSTSERGSAMVEFIFTSTLILIPMVYLVLAAGQLQAASYAVVGAADHAAKVFATSANTGQAESYARDAVVRTMSDFGIDPARATISISCSAECLKPGSTVSVTVDVRVPLPLVPPGVEASMVNVDSSATQRVDRFG